MLPTRVRTSTLVHFELRFSFQESGFQCCDKPMLEESKSGMGQREWSGIGWALEYEPDGQLAIQIER